MPFQNNVTTIRTQSLEQIDVYIEVQFIEISVINRILLFIETCVINKIQNEITSEWSVIKSEITTWSIIGQTI